MYGRLESDQANGKVRPRDAVQRRPAGLPLAVDHRPHTAKHRTYVRVSGRARRPPRRPGSAATRGTGRFVSRPPSSARSVTIGRAWTPDVPRPTSAAAWQVGKNEPRTRADHPCALAGLILLAYLLRRRTSTASSPRQRPAPRSSQSSNAMEGTRRAAGGAAHHRQDPPQLHRGRCNSRVLVTLARDRRARRAGCCRSRVRAGDRGSSSPSRSPCS